MITPELVAGRLADVRTRLAGVGGSDVRIIAVTKAFGIDAVQAAAACGITDVGESYAQETVAKLRGREVTPTVHFIGGLQRNKVRKLSGLVDVWQSVDRAELADEIAARVPGARVMLQVDISDEESKGGCSPEGVAELLQHSRESGLEVLGLMGIGPIGSPEDARPGFRRLRGLVDQFELRECSMGMTADLEVAVEEGSTMIRVGTALFGPRPPR
jgi:pyridoxal phosphate enzyme (YggS family)